uniref:LRRCT domain-containing protein n=1 Tax=Branchiostoma floridae TaxID=7739 RepID=C3YCB3_BRAFL|eukprot:XP_002606135.1 hypothetical protein BRAFLDRAFT_88046 [Branchiostoma floridae]
MTIKCFALITIVSYFGLVSTEDRALPLGCVVSNIPDEATTSTSQVYIICIHKDLHNRYTAIPEGLPSNTITLDISFNCIKNLREIPVLKNLTSLNVRWNRMETVEWLLLRNLPALQYLKLDYNRLVHVNVGAVIKDLPHLRFVGVADNKLSSFSYHQLGFPKLGFAKFANNPFHCDCAMLWLITRLKCWHETMNTEKSPLRACVQCDTCIFGAVETDGMVCARPNHLEGLPLWNVSQYLTGCRDEKLVSTTSKMSELQPRQTQRKGATAKVLGKLEVAYYGRKTLPRSKPQRSPSSTATKVFTGYRNTTRSTATHHMDNKEPLVYIICIHKDLHNRYTAIPEGLPSNTITLDISFNCIKNLREIPVLKNLTSLNMRWNSMETIEWLLLRNLPALQYLKLDYNRLVHVNVGAVIKDLPHLRFVGVADNKLSSFSYHQLGFPKLGFAKFANNPFHCDCAMLWLITRLKCWHETMNTEKSPLRACVQCDTCIFGAVETDGMVCARPNHLEGLPLWNVSQYLTGCRDEKLVSTTSKMSELQPRQTQRKGATAKVLGKLEVAYYGRKTLPRSKPQRSPSSTATKVFTGYRNTTRSTATHHMDNKEPLVRVRHIAVMISVSIVVLISLIIRKFRSGSPYEGDDRVGADDISLHQV